MRLPLSPRKSGLWSTSPSSVQEEKRHHRNFWPFLYWAPMSALTPRQTTPSCFGSKASAVISSLMKRNQTLSSSRFAFESVAFSTACSDFSASAQPCE